MNKLIEDRSRGAEGWGEEADFTEFPLSSVLRTARAVLHQFVHIFPLVPRRERKKNRSSVKMRTPEAMAKLPGAKIGLRPVGSGSV